VLKFAQERQLFLVYSLQMTASCFVKPNKKATLDSKIYLSPSGIILDSLSISISHRCPSVEIPPLLRNKLVAGIFNIMHNDGLRKYLGRPVFQGKPSRTTFQEIISKATDKLNGWKANCLSKAGRTILIQSHLESLPVHTMQCFHLPKHTAEQIDKINRDFFWKKSNVGKGITLTWEKICMPKNKGGLGLCYTDAVNKAFQCKLAWKVITNDKGLWT